MHVVLCVRYGGVVMYYGVRRGEAVEKRRGERAV